jgi:DUF1680 family protein
MGRPVSGSAVEITLDPEHLLGRTVERNRTVAVPALLGELESHGIVDNLRRVATDGPGERQGWWFSDADVAKWLEGASRSGRTDLADPVAAVLRGAQCADGYLSSWVTEPSARYRRLDVSHELFVMGHVVEGLLAHARAHDPIASQVRGPDPVGAASMAAARRIGAHLRRTFTGRDGADPGLDGHPGVEIALLELADAIGSAGPGEGAALARLSRRMVEQWLGPDIAGLDEPGGHAVRMLYLVQAAARHATGGARVRSAWRRRLVPWFQALVDTRMYLTGAVGSQWAGESIGVAYELPHDQAYGETCAACAAIGFAVAMRPLLGEASTAADDVIERVLHNAFLGAAGLGADVWFSANPQGNPGELMTDPFTPLVEGGFRVPPSVAGNYARVTQLAWNLPMRRPWHDVTCCPTSWVRTAARIPELVIDQRADDLWVRQWTACRAEGPGWSVDVVTAMPWEEGIEVRVVTDRARRVHLRIPEWAGWVRDRSPAVRVGGRPVTAEPATWAVVEVGAGSVTIVVELPLQPTVVTAHPRVADARSCVAMTRGPLVYCLEGVDHLPFPDVRTVQFDLDGGLNAVMEHDLLEGVVMINATGSQPEEAEEQALYRPWRPAAYGRPVDLRYIPYFAWNNRGAWPMTIWTPLAPGSL